MFRMMAGKRNSKQVMITIARKFDIRRTIWYVEEQTECNHVIDVVN